MRQCCYPTSTTIAYIEQTHASALLLDEVLLSDVRARVDGAPDEAERIAVERRRHAAACRLRVRAVAQDVGDHEDSDASEA